MRVKKFFCAACKREFPKAWTDDEAAEECEVNYGRAPREDDAVVCDDCYKKMFPAVSP